jgi:hypothetical protein
MSATLASTFFTAIAGMIVISCGWLAVQRLWLRQFPDSLAPGGNVDGDALAGRSGCHGCKCDPTACERELTPLPDKLKEASGYAP